MYHCLKEHPEIYMPAVKELRFFNYNYDDGIESYSEHFTDAGDAKVRGEITPDYYRQDYALLRIKEQLPNVKLIFILRNPIERAFSQYQLYCGTEYKEMSFEQTYRKCPDLIEWGMYGKHLEFIYQHFLKENVLILEYDLLKGNPGVFLQQVFEFLGVDETFEPKNLTKTYNKVIYPKLQRLLTGIGLNLVIDIVKSSFIGDLIRKRQKEKKNEMPEKDFKYLSSCFSEDVKKLGAILGADLSHWLKS